MEPSVLKFITNFSNAAAEGNLTEIEKCLSEGANLLSRSSNFILHSAILTDNAEIVKLILEKIKETQGNVSMHIEAKDASGNTALMSSSACGLVNSTRILLEYGADVLATNNGDTVLHSAVLSDNGEVLRLILDKINETQGNVSPHIEAKDAFGNTALMSSSARGLVNSTRILLEYGADVLARNNDKTVLHSAVFTDNGEVLRLILDKIKETQGNVSPHIEAKDFLGNTPLMCTAARGFVNPTRILLECGADVLARNNDNTALHSAVCSDNTEVLKLILDKINETQGTVIPYIDVKDACGDTPLMWAARSKFVNAAEVLLEYGANVEEKNNLCMTALHWAVQNNHIDIVKLLMVKGANMTAEDINGTTPKDIARDEGRKEINGYLNFCLAEIFREGGKYRDACHVYKKALVIQENCLRSDHPDVLMTVQNMRVTLARLREHDEALETYKNIFDIQKRTDVLGPDHRDALMTRYNMEVSYSDLGRNNERELINIEWPQLSSGHPIPSTSSDVKIIQQRKNGSKSNLSEAEDPEGNGCSRSKDYQQEHESDKRKSVLVPDHPDILMTRRNMEVSYSALGHSDERELLTEKGLQLSSGHQTLKRNDAKIIQQRKKKSKSNLPEAGNPGCSKSKDHKEQEHDEGISLSGRHERETLERVRKEELKKCTAHQSSSNGNKNSWTPLHHAAHVGDLQRMKNLVANGADLLAKDTICGRMPVHIAAREGHTDVIDLLLKKSIDINGVDANNWTPLHYAALTGRLKTVELLIDRGADIHAEEATHGKKAIHNAAESGYSNVVRVLLESRETVDVTDRHGCTPLYYAAWRGHVKTVNFLAQKGANIHAENIRGEKPIHAAASSGCKNIVDFLLDRGANVNDSTKENVTPLHRAAEEGDLEIVKILIQKGANIAARSNSGKIPSDCAREKGHTEVVHFLDSLK